MATIQQAQKPARKLGGSPHYNKELRKLALGGSVTMFTILVAMAFLMPFAYGALTAFKDQEQITRSAKGSILPMDVVTVNYRHNYVFEGERYDIYIVQTTEGRTLTTYEWALIDTDETTGQLTFIDPKEADRSQPDPGLPTGSFEVDLSTPVNTTERYIVTPSEENYLLQDGDEQIGVRIEQFKEDLDIYYVPMDDGEKVEMAKLATVTERTREGRVTYTLFLDPDELYTEPYRWDGRIQTLGNKLKFAPRTNNFGDVWEQAEFPKLFRNTLAIALFGLIGTLLSSICVAYAFARFPLPGKNYIFLVLIGTIVLPSQVRLVPTYAFFSTINWTGTWLPLIVPHFFANAYNVFLLRQYFLTLPREMDEAAMIDGAGPLTILVRIIVPQSWPVIVSVALFHFVFAWNDYFEPLIYLLGKPEWVPISVGIQQFNFIYDQQPHLIQATSLLALVVPIIVFILTQRFFLRGVVFTGVDK